MPHLYNHAGVGPEDVDVLQSYENFTGGVLMSMVEHQFCKPEDVNEFFTPENFYFEGGKLPLNTGGGQISSGQPGLSAGMIQVVEAVRQLRGEGGDRQVPNARNALVTGIGYVNYLRNWNTSIAGVLEV